MRTTSSLVPAFALVACSGREEECGRTATAFTDDDLCLFFSMMTDAARTPGQTCISMSTCEAGANCMEEFIFD